MKLKAFIGPVLLGLVVLDLIYAVVCIFFPQVWFRIIHGVPYLDPQGLLQRTGAIWATFSVLQLAALVNWRRKPYWIAIIAGVRLSEIFADWTYLAFAQDTTSFGRAALFLATPSNMIVSWFFLKSFLELGVSPKSLE